MTAPKTNELGKYLQDRRAKLDPAALGFSMARRRTPGLRREEVAQRANVSTTWYTWLEQGRGGAPSATVLNSIARALMLTDAEREHLYLLGLGRLPDVSYKPVHGITPRLQGVLDALELCPALIRTPTWDIVGWNNAASKVLTNYETLEGGQRNILRLIFNPKFRRANPDWEMLARTMVAVFRADIARAGATESVQVLVDELSAMSPEFKKMWRSTNDVLGHSEGTKNIYHPTAGKITMEFSSFTVDGRPDLNMIVYTPATAADRKKVKALIK